MEAPDLLTPAARAKLAPARILLHETRGFLYLPVLAQTEVAAAAALAHLLADGPGTAPFRIAWPPLPDPAKGEPKPEIWEAARKQLLENLDHAIAIQAEGALLVLDASPSDRHRLARETVGYLNQRREALRSRQLRLLLLWPSDAAEALMAGAPDLWSMRALAPVVEAGDVEVDAVERFIPSVMTAQVAPAGSLSPTQLQQWQRWQAKHDLGAAQLSVADTEALVSALDEQREWVAMAELAEGVLRHLERTDTADGLRQRANALSWLSIARAGQGNRQAALAPAQEAANIGEKLAADNFRAFGPAFATSLNNLSNRLAANGDRAGALATSRRSVEIGERLVADNFATYAPDLASSLNNLSINLAQSGDQAGGLYAGHRAADIYEKLAADNFRAFGPGLATSLNNLAIRLAESGDRTAALAAIRRASDLYEKLCADNFAAHAPNLAKSLSNLSVRLAQNGDLADALATIRRAIDIGEILVADNFAAYAPELAGSLGNLSLQLALSGDRAGAVVALDRAIKLITPFAEPGTLYAEWLSQMLISRERLV